jgi:methylglyoxal synthase
MADSSDADVCAICLGGMVRGQAGFTAECSHAFHLNCISASVADGNHNCPLCKALWTVLPAVNAAQAPPRTSSYSIQAPRPTYQDDDPLQETVPAAEAQAAANGGGAVVLKTHCECPAVARGSSRDNFAVLVHVKAPPAAASEAARAPLDLVTVLDVSSSMSGPKLALLKEAMGFVIDNLGSADRLSVVSFNYAARRVIRLVRTSDAGKAEAKRAVGALVASGSTNIGEGLRVAAQVLDDRRYKNAVTSIMLLSDGRDNTTRHGRNGAYVNLVPPSLAYTGAGNRPPPVHAFGFGTDHDAAAMNTIAEMACGTFSFVQNEAVLQDSFAQCLGGLLTVAVQEARIAMTCLHPGVRVREVMSGRYDSRVDDGGRAASVDVGELYADEERRFLIFLDVPAGAEDADDDVTGLIKLSCNYRDAATGQAVNVAGDDAVVQRPVVVTDVEPSVEVERERLRVAATEDMGAAREAADRGEHAEGALILRRLLEAVSAAQMAGDPMCMALEGELLDLTALAWKTRRSTRRRGAHASCPG